LKGRRKAVATRWDGTISDFAAITAAAPAATLSTPLPGVVGCCEAARPGTYVKNRRGPWRDCVLVPWFGLRMVCTRCGITGADARPNWKE
jgi:hypothetical protein